MGSRDEFKAGLTDIFAICDHAETQLLAGDAHQVMLANAGCRAGLVLLCGYFEGFVRALIEEAIGELNERRVDVARLPDPILCGLMELIALKAGKDREEQVATLRAAIRSGSSHRIPVKAFSKMEGNPSVDRVEKVFGFFGIGNVLDRLSIKDFGVASTFVADSQAEALRGEMSQVLLGVGAPALVDQVLAVVEKKWVPRTKRRKVGYIARIEQLLEKRNRIAHGEGRPEITPQDLRDTASDLQRLGEGLVIEIERVTSEICEFPRREIPSRLERWNYLQIVE